ncbi:hypothetical protein YPPY72_0190, partial [Yersinia pestis PY-72]
MLALGVIGGR